MSQEFCEIVRQSRTLLYKTAKEFYTKNSISCTYAYYSKVEKDTVPEIKIALEIIDKLKINQRKALFAWTRDHMPSIHLKSLFSELDDEATLSTEQSSPSRSLVINRMQAKLLTKNPVYWEILVYMSSFHGKHIPTVKELSQEFHTTTSRIENALDELFEYGMLDKNSQGQFVTREWMLIPYEDEYKNLRDINFKRAFEQFEKCNDKTKFRTTITALLSPQHQKIVEAKILALSNQLIDLSEKESSEASVPFTIGVFSSPRKFGND